MSNELLLLLLKNEVLELLLLSSPETSAQCLVGIAKAQCILGILEKNESENLVVVLLILNSLCISCHAISGGIWQK